VGESNSTTCCKLDESVGSGVNGVGEEDLALGGERDESYTPWNDNSDSERTYFYALTRGRGWQGEWTLARE